MTVPPDDSNQHPGVRVGVGVGGRGVGVGVGDAIGWPQSAQHWTHEDHAIAQDRLSGSGQWAHSSAVGVGVAVGVAVAVAVGVAVFSGTRLVGRRMS